MKIFEFRDFLFGKNGVYLEISSFFTETSDWKEQNTDSDNGFENSTRNVGMDTHLSKGKASVHPGQSCVHSGHTFVPVLKRIFELFEYSNTFFRIILFVFVFGPF